MRYLTITHPDINNGSGFRATIWFAGCSHHCPGCHNPHTWSYEQGKDIKELYDEIKPIVEKDYISGITLSGGDPLTQTDESLQELKDFILWFKETYPKKNIWLFTGYTVEELKDDSLKMSIINLCDTIVDGPYIETERDVTLAFRGSTNQRIIHNV